MGTTVTAYGIEDVLQQCGVTETTLTPTERAALDEQGYGILPDVMDAAWLKQLWAAFESVAKPQAETTPERKQTGTRHVPEWFG